MSMVESESKPETSNINLARVLWMKYDMKVKYTNIPIMFNWPNYSFVKHFNY